MISFEETYENRKKEIDMFIKVINILQEKECNRDSDGRTEFDKFFNYGGQELSYVELVNILKSNLSLMVYNLIEYTVSNLIESIYDEIQRNGLSYLDVNEKIRDIWKNVVLKAANDPNANYYTFIKKNNEIIEFIIERKTIEMHARDSLPAGNLDGERIMDAFKRHGVSISRKECSFYVLSSIKQQRNELAHGTVSFSEAVQNYSISEIKHDSEMIGRFLDGLIEDVKEFIRNRLYCA